MTELDNPFPGPQPYRASDRDRFFGREDMALRLQGDIVANRCVTVYGPSGAGKSSLVQAAVIPGLVASDGIRAVRIDGWPEGEDPTRWLAAAMYAQLGLGEVPAELAPGEAIVQAAQRVARRSPRLVLIYLDQIEQLLHPSRLAAGVDAFFEQVQRLVDLPLRNARVALSLREDYLGRFRDRLRDRGRLLDNGFRVGPLTVAELCEAVCQAAAAGEPPQRWSPEQTRELILQVRVPGEAATDDAEAQAAYAQIVCRALFRERGQGRDHPSETTLTGLTTRDTLEDRRPSQAEVAVEAESILRRYLDAMLETLGPLVPEARRLLEDHLIAADGTRTLRTEKELLRIMPLEALRPILAALEGAAILRAEAHQGSRYFEIGHDWLARKVYEQRQDRERAEEQERASQRHRANTAARLTKARAQRRLLVIFALVSLVVAAGGWTMSGWALAQQGKADKARHDADRRAVEASDARLLAGFRELKNSGQLAWATKLLPEVQRPEAARGWVALASDALRASVLERTLGRDDPALGAGTWSPDGKRILTASADGTVRLASADGWGHPIVLGAPHGKPVTAAAWSRDGGRVLTGSEDGTARLWSAERGEPLSTLEGHKGSIVAVAFDDDGKRVLTASRDGTARVWSTDGSGMVELKGHTGPLTGAAFHPDGERVFTASEDGTARLWSARGAAPPVVFAGHSGAVVFVAPSPDGTHVVTTSRDRTARLWDVSSKGKPVVLAGHQGSVDHAAWSQDGKRVATASADKTVRLWNADGTGEIVLRGHAGAVTSVAFRPDGRYVASASLDQTARVWPAEGGSPLVLSGHEAPVRSVAWSPDGSRVLTAAGAAEKGAGAGDHTARIWRTTLLSSLPRQRHGFFHSAFVDAGGQVVVSAYDDRKARLWRVDEGGTPVVFEGHGDWITSAALSRDGERIATTSLDGTARLWSADGTFERSLEGHTGPVRAAAFCADGTRVVTASDDATARVWSADGQGEPAVLRGHTGGLTSAAWSPDDQRLVTTSLDGTARVWRADGAFERALEGHGGEVHTAAWSPDGRRIATASEDGTAQIWDAATGAPLVMLEHRSPVVRAAWSPDGTRLATSSMDGKVRVWSADGRGEPVELEARTPLLALIFREDGKTILGVGADDTTSTWTIDVGALRAGLAAANADCLPAEMRITYFGESADEARKKYAACEAASVRAEPEARAVEAEASGPAVQAPAGPKGSDTRPPVAPAGERRVTVFVLPGDALVEVDGKPVRRRDGVIEVLVKAGGERSLKASAGVTGTMVAERSATIQEAADKPLLVDLNEKPSTKGPKRGKATRFGFDY